MEAGIGYCPEPGCGYIADTPQNLTQHKLEHESQPRPNTSTLSRMTILEIAQLLAGVDEQCLTEILFRVYTIRMVNHW